MKLPEGEDLNEWLAVNGAYSAYMPLTVDGALFFFFPNDDGFATVVDFYNQVNLLYGSITEFCSPVTCPEMKATDE